MDSNETRYQTKNAMGEWQPIESEGYYSFAAIAGRILGRESWLAERLGRAPLVTVADIESALTSGQTLSHGDDWWAEIRQTPATGVTTARQTVACDCGHSVDRFSVMVASLGTACPDCYDRMSA